MKPKFNIGQEVEFNSKVRTLILKDAINFWQNCKITNLITYKNHGWDFPTKQDYPDLHEWKDGSRKVFGKIWDEKKGWIRHLMTAFDTRTKVTIIGIELCNGSTQHTSIYNNYSKTLNYGYYKYKCLIDAPNGNYFYTWLLDSYLKKIK